MQPNYSGGDFQHTAIGGLHLFRHHTRYRRRARRTVSHSASRHLGFETLESRQLLAAANLLINELMAVNDQLVADGDGNFNDWIEIRNADAVPVNLGDYYLTDNDTNLTKWKLPSINLAAGAFRVVYASAPLDANGEVLSNYIDDQGRYHTNFKLDAEGEDLVLSYKDPMTQVVSVVHEYAGGYPDQFPNISYGIASGDSARYLTPTLGAANGAGFLGAVEDTKFSVDRGFYNAPFQLTITTDTPTATIYYTTDGSKPSASNGILYSGPLTIDHTTVVRAIATKANYVSTNVDTQSYFFVNDIVRQTQQMAVDAGYPSVWQADNGNFTADYGFDPDVIGNFDANGNPLGGDLYGGIYAARIKNDLLAIPTISIVLDPDDMFGQDLFAQPEGIYIDPRQDRNPDPERPTSVEWITMDGAAELQVDAGIQIQGGAFRSHALTRKHSFRLVFKEEYGPSELSFPLFDDSAVTEFNTIVLKATANDGYSWSASQQTLQYARDQFGHSLQRAMGHPSGHDTYAHLYVNGMYWGLYSAAERPDNDFAASYLGANPDNWDAIHDNEANSGDFNAWFQMLNQSQAAGSSLTEYMKLQGKNVSGTPNPSNPPLLDVVNYIDYLIINVWGGNDDWPHHNFWAGRDRSPLTTEGFKFFLWDFDGVMGNSRSWSPLNTKTFDQGFTGVNNVGQIHTYLKPNPEYKLQFADRVHKYFFNDGLFDPDNLIARYQEIVDQVDDFIVAESARWGDLHSTSPLTLNQWTIERDWLLNAYLPQRSAIVMQEMREYGFYPDTDAPIFNQFGGYVPNGFGLMMSAPAGTIYYTLDGSDPRVIGGAVSGGALVYTGAPITISGDVTVRARVLNGSEWSALNEADFTNVVPGDVAMLRITELQYHPANHPSVADDEDLEYIEVMNTDSLPVSLDGVEIAGFANEPYVFAAGQTLEPGERIVVARSPAVFQSVYGTGINLAPTGYFDNNLSNSGELVMLLGPQGQIIHSFTYDDSNPWPSAPDGSGRSLEIIDPLGNSSDPSNWRSSLYFIGSPGTEGLPLPGDYDASGTVDAADRATWNAAFGSMVQQPGNGADGNRDGRIDAADYTVWRDYLGTTTTLYGAAGGAASSAISAAIVTSATTTLVSGKTPSEDPIGDSPSFAAITTPFEGQPPARVENRVDLHAAAIGPPSANARTRGELLLAMLSADREQPEHADDDVDLCAASKDKSPESLSAAVDRVFEVLEQTDDQFGVGF
jgi:hypothetical protein